MNFFAKKLASALAALLVALAFQSGAQAAPVLSFSVTPGDIQIDKAAPVGVTGTNLNVAAIETGGISTSVTGGLLNFTAGAFQQSVVNGNVVLSDFSGPGSFTVTGIYNGVNYDGGANGYLFLGNVISATVHQIGSAIASIVLDVVRAASNQGPVLPPEQGQTPGDPENPGDPDPIVVAVVPDGDEQESISQTPAPVQLAAGDNGNGGNGGGGNGDGGGDENRDPQDVPEPMALMLIAAGLLVLWGVRRRRKTG